MSGNRTLLGRGRWPCRSTLLTPARTSSRIEWPRAAACSFSLRYRGAGISTVVRTDSCFIVRLFHFCHKYGRGKTYLSWAGFVVEERYRLTNASVAVRRLFNSPLTSCVYVPLRRYVMDM